MLNQTPQLTSIIVVAHGNGAMTDDCLRTLTQNTLSPYEIIGVDDGSYAGEIRCVIAVFRQFTSKAYRIEHSGAAVARNEGLKHARGDHIVFLDNDCFVTEGWLTILTRAASADPAIGIIAAIPSNEISKLSLPRSPDGLIDAEEVGSTCMLITRRAFHALGFLDPALGWCGEDTDYCYRAKLAGFRVAIAPDVIVNHLQGATRNRLDQRLIRASRARFFDKWRHHTEFELIRRHT